MKKFILIFFGSLIGFMAVVSLMWLASGKLDQLSWQVILKRLSLIEPVENTVNIQSVFDDFIHFDWSLDIGSWSGSDSLLNILYGIRNFFMWIGALLKSIVSILVYIFVNLYNGIVILFSFLPF